MDAIRGKPFPASHGPCPTNVPVVPSVSHFLNLVVGHEHEFGKQGKPRGQRPVVQRRKTAVTTCPTNSGRYPLYSTNLLHFFSRVRYSRKVGQVVTRGRLPPMSRRFACPTNRLEKWDNGGTCSLLWDTFAGARLPERLPAPAPPCVIPHRRPARRRRAAAAAPETGRRDRPGDRRADAMEKGARPGRAGTGAPPTSSCAVSLAVSAPTWLVTVLCV